MGSTRRHLWKSLTLKHIRINGRWVELNFPPSERQVQEHEFGKIVFDDCYRLKQAPGAATVLDIGANIGLFSLAARRAFPKATIHAYEPNPSVLPYLRSHCQQIGATFFPEAIGSSDGKVSLRLSEDGTLFSVAQRDASGQINQRSFASAVANLGKVDLLKLDCEGAEWDLFADRRPWSSVGQLQMEYHLWAREGLSVAMLRRILSQLDFTKIDIREGGPKWGMAFASRL
jgi:FkbM family methyltransferase